MGIQSRRKISDRRQRFSINRYLHYRYGMSGMVDHTNWSIGNGNKGGEDGRAFLSSTIHLPSVVGADPQGWLIKGTRTLVAIVTMIDLGLLRCFISTWAVFLMANVWAQSYWSAGLGGPGNDHVRDVKTDAAGNIYATGEFSGAITFGGNTYVSTAGIDMFLAKLTPGGQVLWFVQGGGPGIDGGIKLAVRGDRVAVVGTFMHTATFQGQELTSAGAQDIFISMHDAATGALQWVAGGGGLTASDRPYGVTIASTGNVTMVGEFSGTVQVAGDVLTSMIDPQTGTPSVDVFIATYSPAGEPLWTLRGAAKYTDRAIDVVNDPADNIYVTGQFSDTIQFTVPHPNVMYNASFLLKLDPDGHEQWFRRMGGAVYNHVRDMQWASTGELLMVGDVQGNMVFLDSVPNFVSSGDPHAYYLLRVDHNGQLAGDTVVSSMNPVSGRAVDERDGLVTVLGEFKCQFTSMVDSLQTGLWSATGIQDLFVVQHALDSLYVIKGAQQFGGRQEKLAGQVASLNDGSPVFCGSFEDMIVFPCQGSFTADIASTFPPHGLMAPNTAGYCDDPYYGSFAADTSNGLKDGFIARGFVPGRSAYDWWTGVAPTVPSCPVAYVWERVRCRTIARIRWRFAGPTSSVSSPGSPSPLTTALFS